MKLSSAMVISKAYDKVWYQDLTQLHSHSITRQVHQLKLLFSSYQDRQLPSVLDSRGFVPSASLQEFLRALFQVPLFFALYIKYLPDGMTKHDPNDICLYAAHIPALMQYCRLGVANVRLTLPRTCVQLCICVRPY